jgi:hypothetical protein
VTAPCGTNAAYQRHLRHGETPDLACRLASAADRKRRWQARRQLGQVEQETLIRETVAVLAAAMCTWPDRAAETEE